MYLFRSNPDKVTASYWAGALFVLIPISMMMREWIFFKFLNRFWWAAVLQFWFGFALPIFVMRVIHPRESLSGMKIGFIEVDLWHKASNLSYLLLMAVTLLSWFLTRKKPN